MMLLGEEEGGKEGGKEGEWAWREGRSRKRVLVVEGGREGGREGEKTTPKRDTKKEEGR
jgi:hypothetical protein